MVNKRFREAIKEYSRVYEVEVIILNDPAYDNSVIGISEGRLIYDLERMIEEHALDCAEEDGDEIFSEEGNPKDLEILDEIIYNTIRTLPYLGENAPIILDESFEGLIEKYGD